MSIPNLAAQPTDLATNASSYWTRRLWRAFSARQRRRRAIEQLNALSDWCLADIGIERSEIEAVVRACSQDISRCVR